MSLRSEGTGLGARQGGRRSGVVDTASADQPAETDTRSEENVEPWHQSREAALAPIASMMASILSLAVGSRRRKA